MRNRLLIVAAIAWLYVTARFIWYLPGGNAVRITAAIALLLIAEYQQITSRWFGTFVSPELPRRVLIGIGWAFGALFILVPLLVLRDVAGGAAFLVAPPLGHEIWTRPGIARGIGVLSGAVAAIGTWEGIRIPRIRTVPVTLSGLPPAFDGYRVVQLSDLHASRLLPAKWIARVVTKANALAPDLIVITGDLADGTPQARAADVAPYASLHARDGVLAIPGNHEYYTDYRAWMAVYARRGLRMLINRHVQVTRGADRVAVAGLTDRQSCSFGEPRPDVDAAIAGVPQGVPIILLDHQPINARANAAAGVALQLSGHTHGGQIPGIDVITRRANHGFISGLYRVGTMQLYISSGTGLWNGLIVRFGHPSEITELVLRAPNRGNAARVQGNS